MKRKSIRLPIVVLMLASATLPLACNIDTAQNVPATGSMMGLQRAGTEYSELVYPLPPAPATSRGKLPPPDGHNVVWYKNGAVVGNPGRVSGVVGRHVAGNMEIETNDGRLTLQYAIPGTKMLPVKTGEKVTFAFRRGSVVNASDFVMVDSVGPWLSHASCRVTGDSALVVPLTNGITVCQETGGEVKIIGGNRVRQVPAKLKYPNGEIELNRSKSVTIVLNGRHYSVQLMHSMEQRPEGEHKKYSEWEGYSLECLVIPSDGIL